MQLVFTSLLPGYVFALYDDAIPDVAAKHAALPDVEVISWPGSLQFDEDAGRWRDPRTAAG
jgi:hypothetical protein